MVQKISDFFTGLFGSAGKWVMVGIIGVVVILCIVLFSFVIANIKWILLGGSAAAVIAGAIIIAVKKIKEKKEKEAEAVEE